MRRHAPYITAVDPANAVWIGGPGGSGRDLVAEALAERFRLHLYSLEDRALEHEPRMPQTADASFVTTSRHRFRLVLEDLRGLPDGALVLVEGPQLLPTNVAAVLRSPDHALFLLPDLATSPDPLIAQTFEREARELRLPTLRIADDVVEVAAARLAPVIERLRLSAAGDTSP
jgi:hypothetical protein